jgi:hypothetical protein
VIGKGNYGQPKGVIFSGQFTGTITWTFISKVGGVVTYQLSGKIVGQLYDGRTVSGTTTQTIYSSPHQLKGGIGHISMGNSTLNTPEPSTLGLLGTGLIGIAGMVRRKLVS